MAQSFTADQATTIARLQVISATIIDQIRAGVIIAQEAIDKGYTPGTPTTGITDAIAQASAPQLLASDITAAVQMLQKLDAALAATTITLTGSTRVGYIALEKMRP